MIKALTNHHFPDGASAPETAGGASAMPPAGPPPADAERFRKAVERPGVLSPRAENGAADRGADGGASRPGRVPTAEAGRGRQEEKAPASGAERQAAKSGAPGRKNVPSGGRETVGPSRAEVSPGPGASGPGEKESEAPSLSENRPAPSRGEVILAGWQGAVPAGLVSAPAPERTGGPSGAAPAHGEAVARLGERLVERIVSTAPTAAGTAEVRITLKDAVLPNTEIRLRRERDGLAVMFVTDNARAERTLGPRLDELRQALEQRFPGGVEVAVSRSDGGGQAGGDGRSRARRNAYEEWAVRDGEETGRGTL